jgi:hypothetical protein
MDLSARFAQVASGNIVRINTLEEGRRYAVTFVQRQETQYGPSVLLTLNVGPDENVKIFLPKRYTVIFKDEDIEGINEVNLSYSQIYHGRYPGSRSFKLTLEH